MIMPGFPRVDREQLDTFVRALFCHADAGGYVQLRAFRDDQDGTWRSEDWPAPQIEAGFANLINEAEQFAGECAAAAVPVVFAPPIATFMDRQKAAEKDIRNGVTLSVECDQCPTRARDRLVTVLGPPTIALASGGEWIDPGSGEMQPKLHLHWRLVQPSRTFAEHVTLKEARRAAMALIGADPSGVPLVHPMRWAGTWHRKGKPRLATIVECNADVEITLTEALTRLKAARGNGADRTVARETPAHEEASAETALLIAAILRAEDYHGPIAQLAMRYLMGGMADAQAVQTLRGILLAVDPGRRDYKNGAIHKDRWLSRYNDIPRAVSTARSKIDETETASRASVAPLASSWPGPLNKAAYHGILGEAVLMIAPHTEADPAALLFHFLVFCGNCVGNNAWFQIEATRHFANLFAVIVGDTSKARKGTAAQWARRLLRRAQHQWEQNQTGAGLSTGEGLIERVRDPRTERKRDKVTGTWTDEVVDPGIADKRLLVVEEELARPLRVMRPVRQYPLDGTTPGMGWQPSRDHDPDPSDNRY